MVLGGQVEWALHCMSLLAALPPGALAPAAALAEIHELPKPYLQKALQAMAAAGLVETVPGPKGGYRLARDAAAITFLDVVEAVEGKQRSFRCTEIRRQGPCAPAKVTGICEVAGVMYEADEAWRAVLRAQTLAALRDRLQTTLDPALRARMEAWFGPRLNLPKAPA